MGSKVKFQSKALLILKKWGIFPEREIKLSAHKEWLYWFSSPRKNGHPLFDGEDYESDPTQAMFLKRKSLRNWKIWEPFKRSWSKRLQWISSWSRPRILLQFTHYWKTSCAWQEMKEEKQVCALYTYAPRKHENRLQNTFSSDDADFQRDMQIETCKIKVLYLGNYLTWLNFLKDQLVLLFCDFCSI